MIIPGQTPLESLNLGLTPEIRRLLQSLWIESIEELGALANAPKMKPSDAQGKTYTNTLASCACAALNQLPEMVRERVAVPAPMGAFGCLFAPELVETYRGRIMPVGELRAADSSLDLPARVDLKGQMHAVRDQGERGTCVAFATVALREFLDRAGMHLSEQFLYFKCKELDGAPVSGTFLRTALSVLHGYGVCRAITWPYVPRHIPGNEGQGPPPAGVDEEANLYIMPYGRSVQPSHVPQYKRILAGYREIPGMPVVVGTLMFASWAQSAEGQRTGKMTLPLPGEEPVGGHAWCIVGYQDASFVPGGGYFIARNSWGGGVGACFA